MLRLFFATGSKRIFILLRGILSVKPGQIEMCRLKTLEWRMASYTRRVIKIYKIKRLLSLVWHGRIH
jgi:hypothetical protein